ncbi:hypothetical protein [Rhizobium rhizogenes]|uniref:hypothetical protein n=1 Tax=Rhizobium rhizogenes TaxID=359 RepID=UPI001572DF91|nr:hypothetical protein [Rhizobium rhizogenes]NTG07233.1 hypothetical protein [Rhizobium rhizogenes]
MAELMLRRLFLVSVPIGLAFSIYLILIAMGHAKEVQTKPDMALPASQRAISAVSDVPPCFARPRAPKRMAWVLTAKDGTVLVVGAEDVRKKC